jgi:hypothetical protein
VRCITCRRTRRARRAPWLTALARTSCAEAIAAVIAQCKDGAKVLDLCQLGDDIVSQ